jgi:hypothetical protein
MKYNILNTKNSNKNLKLIIKEVNVFCGYRIVESILHIEYVINNTKKELSLLKHRLLEN